MEHICRTCLCEGADVYIFDKSTPASTMSQDFSHSVCTMVTNCTELEFFENDGLPPRICRKCLDIVLTAFAFKLQAKKAEEQLKNHFVKTNFSRENYLEFSDNVTIKTEIKNSNDNDESNFDDYDAPSNVDFDDSEDDLKPLIELKNIKKSADSKRKSKSFEKSVPCNICSEKFKSSFSLENHKRGCHYDYPQCDICSRTFTKIQYLTRHKIAAHSCATDAHGKNDKVENTQSITCVLCGLKFNGEDHLISHINLSHSGPKKRGRPSKKALIENKLKLKKILETMNIKTETDYFDVTESSNELYNSMSCSPLTLETKPEINPETNEIVTFCCSLCPKIFYSAEIFAKHNAKHLAFKPCLCKLCNKTIKYIYNVKKHFQSHIVDSFANIDLKSISNLLDNDEKLAKQQIILTDDMVKNKIKDIIKAENFYLFISEVKISLENQIISDSESSVVNIDVQNSKIHPNQNFKSKKNVITPKVKKYTCSICNYTFSRSNHIMRHMSTHNFDFPDKCDVCHKVFPNKILLKNHKFRQCENTTKAFECDICNMKFAHHISLNKHITRQHKNTPISVDIVPTSKKRIRMKSFSCSSCDKQFYRQHHLDRHIRTHLPKEKKYECPTCLKKFHRIDNLRTHTLIHKTKTEPVKKTFLCMYCGKSFATSSHLLIHVRRHRKENPFKCDICGKGFPRTSDFKYHRRTHTGEKPYQCTVCGRGFSRSDKLARHMRIHTGVKPYKCTYCDRAFTQSNDLTLHIRRHTGDKPYVCEICGDCFIQGTALQNHKRMRNHYVETNENS